MQLQTLSADELAFLTAPQVERAEGAEGRWLEGRLAAALAARLRLSVALDAQPAVAASEGALAAPVWQPDATLATLWLTRRLGGMRAAGSAPFVSRGLIAMLDATLAEAWLGLAARPLTAACAWNVATPLGTGKLALQLPRDGEVVTRWARGVIRHA